jgi:isopentenyldiphosphate isomerase
MAQSEYFLIVDVWIMNNKGEFLISKRTPTAKKEPNRWQPTCGCAIAGEDSISAALRETKEEIGVKLNPDSGRMLKRYIAWENAIVDIWLFQSEVDINEVVLRPEETVDAMWATSGSIKEFVKNDKFLMRIPYLEELFQICRV